jgi:hypothetical protein
MKKIVSLKLAGWDQDTRIDQYRKNPKKDKGEYDAQNPSASDYEPFPKSTFMLGPGLGTNRDRRSPVGLGVLNVNEDEDLSKPELTSHTQQGPVDDNEGDMPITDRTYQTNQKLDWMAEMGPGAILNSRDQNPQIPAVLKSIYRRPSIKFPRLYNADEAAQTVYDKLR